jgi:Transglycosylase-like domain
LRLHFSLSLAGLAAVLAFVLAGAAFARQSVHPERLTSARALRAVVDHYRLLAWTYQRAAHRRPTPTSFSYRRSTDPGYLRWAVEAWAHRAAAARTAALERLHRSLAVALPAPPPAHSGLQTRIDYSRRLTTSLRLIYPGTYSVSAAPGRSVQSAAGGRAKALHEWEVRSAEAALAVARHGFGVKVTPYLKTAFSCIHRYEGTWSANTGNGYYGGLQMDLAFQHRYGSPYLRRWGTADRWPAWAQLQAAARAYRSGRGFYPWPNTARFCGLL